jgi:hypothetical protein
MKKCSACRMAKKIKMIFFCVEPFLLNKTEWAEFTENVRKTIWNLANIYFGI